MSDDLSRRSPIATELLGIRRDVLAEFMKAEDIPRSVGPETEALLSLSREVRSLSAAKAPDASVLERTCTLFDDVAAKRWHSDPFGERYELCQQLSFVAWRHAYLLGMERETQEWLRIAELLYSEYSTSGDCLRSFLFLPRREKTASLWAATIRSSADVFLAIAVLRREKSTRSRMAAEIAGEVYAWVGANTPFDGPSIEREALLGELAFLVALCCRNLARIAEARRWLKLAHAHFRCSATNKPLRLRVQLERLLLSKVLHRHDLVRRRLPPLRDGLQSLGMYRDAQLCRFAIATSERMVGRNVEAFLSFSSIWDDLANSSEHGLLSRVAAHIAELHALGGEFELARKTMAYAMEQAEMSGDGASIGNAWGFMGSTLLEMGDLEDSAVAFRKAVINYLGLGSDVWSAYFRIVLADVLIPLGRIEEALQELLVAVPVLSRERMIPEGIHALKLLGQISTKLSNPEGASAEIVKHLQERLRN